MKYHTYTIDQLREAIKPALCYSDVLRAIGLSTHGSNTETIKKLIDKYQIDTSHFDRIQAYQRNKRVWSFEQIFCENSKVPRPSLRRMALKFDILKYKCEECPVINVYNNKPISLTLDHKNGITNDNRVENLRWLCPNCHSQTDNYCGKNKC